MLHQLWRSVILAVNGKVVFKLWMSPTCTTPLALTGTFCCGVMCNSHCLGKVIVLILPGQPQSPENHRLLSWDPFTFTKPQASSYEHYGIGSHQWDYVSLYQKPEALGQCFTLHTTCVSFPLVWCNFGLMHENITIDYSLTLIKWGNDFLIESWTKELPPGKS